MGKQFLFIELIAFIAWMQYLVAPLIFKGYGISMLVPYDEYFSFVIPATSLFLLGMYLPCMKFINSKYISYNVREQIHQKFSVRGNDGGKLVLIGIPIWLIQPYTPAGVNYIFSLLSFLLLIGMCMLLFSKEKKDIILILVGFVVMISNTLLHGMIGVTIFWFLILFIYRSLYISFKFSFLTKVVGFSIALFFLLVMQSSKTMYRVHTWKMSQNAIGEGKRKIESDPELFLKLITERIIAPEVILQSKSMLPLLARVNQGFIVSKVMNWVPNTQNFGFGDITFFATLTSFIPRILYPDKPTIGTREYYKKYTGEGLGKFNSVTLGCVGDAYADYGRYGMVYLLFFGLLIGFMYRYFFLNYYKDPLLIFWFAILFYYSITVNEISIPGYLNGLLKGFFFIFTTRIILKNFNFNV